MPHLDGQPLTFAHTTTPEAGRRRRLDLNSEPGSPRYTACSKPRRAPWNAGAGRGGRARHRLRVGERPPSAHRARRRDLPPFGQDGPYVTRAARQQRPDRHGARQTDHPAATTPPGCRQYARRRTTATRHGIALRLHSASSPPSGSARPKGAASNRCSIQASLAVTVEFADLYSEYERGDVIREHGRHAYRATAHAVHLLRRQADLDLAIPEPLEEKGGYASSSIWRAPKVWVKGKVSNRRRATRRRASKHGGAILSALEVLTAQHSARNRSDAGQRLGLTWGAVRAPEEWLDDPHAAARGYFAPVEHLSSGGRSPTRARRTSSARRRGASPAARRYGEDTARVLADAGVSTGDIAALTSTSDTAAASPRGE